MLFFSPYKRVGVAVRIRRIKTDAFRSADPAVEIESLHSGNATPSYGIDDAPATILQRIRPIETTTALVQDTNIGAGDWTEPETSLASGRDVREHGWAADDTAASHAQDDLLAMFGGGSDTRRFPSSPVDAASPMENRVLSANIDPDELIHTLQAHYRVALTSRSLGSWESPLESAFRLLDEPEANLSDERNDAGANAGLSVSSLFHEPQRLEDAIGPLVPEDALDRADMNLAAAPEILQLFAPPEYRANGASRRPAMPPALARREHQTLAIDSPLHEFNAPTAEHWKAESK